MKSYKILDNGGYGFLVQVDQNHDKLKTKNVKIYDIYRQDPSFENDGHKSDKILVKKFKNVKKIFIRDNILLKLSANRYVHIGMIVKEFKLLDDFQIIEYKAPIGNSACPNPWARSKTYFYLLDYQDNLAIPVEQMKNEDPKLNPYDIYYGWFYGLGSNKNTKQRKKISDSKGVLEFPMKKLVDRPF